MVNPIINLQLGMAYYHSSLVKLGMVYCFDLFWGLQGLVLPLNHSTILLTSSREDLSDSRVLNHPNHPKKMEPNVRDVLLAVSSQLEKLTNFEAVKSDSVTSDQFNPDYYCNWGSSRIPQIVIIFFGSPVAGLPMVSVVPQPGSTGF